MSFNCITYLPYIFIIESTFFENVCHAAPAPAFSFSRTDSGLAVGADNSPRSFSEFVGGGSNEVWFKGPPRFEWCKGGALAAGSIIFVVVKLLL